MAFEPGVRDAGDVETGTTGAGRVPGDGDGDGGVGDGDRGVGGESAPAPTWHKDDDASASRRSVRCGARSW